MQETEYSPGLPLTVALLSDTHDGDEEPVLRSLRARKPDVICVAGDVIYGYRRTGACPLEQEQPHVLPLLRGCAALAPTCLSLGNHERRLTADDLALLRDTGCTLLDNGWIRQNGLVIGGLTSAAVTDRRREEAGDPPARRGRPALDWLDGFETQEGLKILLCHHPEYYPRWLRERAIDFVFSGHAHGGQWRLGGRGLYAPGQGLFPRYTAGMYEGRLIVSRGLSNTAGLPRLGNPTEIVYIR